MIWEYKVIQDTQYFHAPDLDEAGSAGWELVSVVQAGPNNQVYAYFKRPYKAK